MEQLKKCPFCGDEFEIVGNGHYYAHKINGCILKHLCFECDDVEAIKLWNTRKPMERIVERLESEFEKHRQATREYLSIDDDSVGLRHLGKASAFSKAIKIMKDELN